MIPNVRLIGLAGAARSGKDSFFQALNLFSTRVFNRELYRVALADPLKVEVRDFCIGHYRIDPLNCNIEEKELIRPILVAHGDVKRKQTQGRYFTNLAEINIRNNSINVNDLLTYVITDIRYCIYDDTDELYWLRNNGGKLIYLERFDEQGKIIEGANDHERANNIILRQKADMIIQMPTYQIDNTAALWEKIGAEYRVAMINILLHEAQKA